MDHATSFNKAHGVVQPCDYFFANMLLLPLWKVPRGGHQYCGMCIIGSHVHLAWYIWRSDFLLCLFAIFKKTTASYQKWMCFMYPFFLQYMAAPQKDVTVVEHSLFGPLSSLYASVYQVTPCCVGLSSFQKH
ncbi:unnamed protein product [Urochloa humidicola]